MIGYVVWFVGVLCFNRLAGIFAKYRAEKYLASPYKALPDVFQETLPGLPVHVPDYLLFCLGLYVFFFRYPKDYVELDTLLYSLSFRPIFVSVTTLPTCMKRQNVNNFFLSTHDLIFSGHTCLFIFFGKLIGGSLGNIVQIIFPITLIQARQHYTIDVLVSMVVYKSLEV